jgi:hypothetical protein
MMILDFWFLCIAGPAVLFAGVSKGGFGSGAAFASSSVLALVIEPGVALGIMLPLLMLMDASTLKPYWGKWGAHEVKLLVLGGIPGVVLGALLYKIASPDFFRLLIGCISVGFVIWQLGRAKGWIRAAQRAMPDWAGYFWGSVAGFTSFVSHAGGPPAAIYLLSRGLEKTQFQATTVLLFWILNIVKFIPYAFLGIFTWETMTADLVLAPFAVVGAWIGVKAHRFISQRQFFAITYVLLLATGSKLIWDGLT